MSTSEHVSEVRKKKSRIWAGLRANFLTGLVVVAPIGLTMYLVWTAIGIIDSWVLPWIPEKYQPSNYIGPDVRGAGVVIFLTFTVIVGYITKGLIGRSILRSGEILVDRMPIVRSVYNGIKQIAETVVNKSETSFDRACLIEYPRRGLWAIAFYSSSAKKEVSAKLPPNGKMVSVFLPTTPNPTSGFLLFVEETDIIYLEMAVEDAAKLVISAGLVYPPQAKLTK